LAPEACDELPLLEKEKAFEADFMMWIDPAAADRVDGGAELAPGPNQ
jgi:hypothetical protein